MSLQLPQLPPPLNHRSIPVKQPPPPPPCSVQCALTKKGHRLLTSITTTSEPLYNQRLLKKLISEASWFDWNAKLVAQLIASLYKQERFDEAECLYSEAISRLIGRERDLCNFYCHCVEFSSKNGSTKGVLEFCEKLKRLVSDTSSIYVKKRAYESMINGLCVAGLVLEAEDFMVEMKDLGLKASIFEYRSIVYAYGKAGLFEDMKKIISNIESEGFVMDTVCCNMVLSSLGSHNELQEMILWLQRMKDLDIPLSIRSFNTVLNSCPNLMSMLENPKNIPLSIEELVENLSGSETKLVEELIMSSSSVIEEAMEWGSSELKLDLHGMHLGSAYLVFLKWLGELRHICLAKDCIFPTQITVVCGLGKHSSIRGKSSVKRLIREIIEQMNCPLRIDRKNVGCFIVKGSVFKFWLT
ncbi:hypothetical protein Leryth_009236 [Lithospermum erythrorhizon]|nr:hypothetical protein Leryth_009236 [Lithospermum erythrorhizon]